jgi:hypothetical protein
MEALVVPVLAAARAWYGLELTGLNNIPDGPALIVGNHDSGMTFLEAIGWGAAIHAARPHEAWLGLTHDGIIDMPGVGGLLISVGAVRARPDLALAALRAGHKVVVFPGGNTEAFRPWSRRYEVDLAGRIGWARPRDRGRRPRRPRRVLRRPPLVRRPQRQPLARPGPRPAPAPARRHLAAVAGPPVGPDAGAPCSTSRCR